MTPPTVQQAPPAPPPAQPKIVPEMPRIPGVNDAPKPPRSDSKPLIAVIVVVIILTGGFALWLSHRRHVAEVKTSALAQPDTEPAISHPPPAEKATNADPEAIATLDELAKPWASKKFTFVDPKTHESVPAMVIHLPASGVRGSFWAFSLNTPFSQCELQYVTDLAALSQRYAYPAAHPMIVSDCDGTLYDPLRMATLSDGAWVRGEIVRGGGIRPPIAIQVHLRGRVFVADRIE